MRTFWTAILAFGLLGTAACSNETYQWTGVPYCSKGEEGMSAKFEENLYALISYGDEANIWHLTGYRTSRVDRGATTPFLVAVVACDDGEKLGEGSAESKLSAFDASTVPEVCAGQETLVEPTEIEPEETPDPKVTGMVDFPDMPKEELTCTEGKLVVPTGTG